MPVVCGRIATTTPLEQIAQAVGARGPLPPWRPRYNQPPGEPIPNVIEEGGERRIAAIVWGLPTRHGSRYINVTAEKLARSAGYTPGRSLIFVDGFYEWDKRRRQPYYIRARNGHPLPLAAVVGSAGRPGCAVITTAANDAIARVHHRMPAVIPRAAWDAWLDPAWTDRAQLHALLRPWPLEWIELYPVSKAANNPRHDAPDSIAPDPAACAREAVGAIPDAATQRGE